VAGWVLIELATTIASRYQREREFFSATGPTDDGFAENATDCLFATAGGARPTLLAIGLTNAATQRQGTLIWWGGLQTVQAVLVNRRAKVSRATWTSPSTSPSTVVCRPRARRRGSSASRRETVCL
jgi:hypothetical protein